MMNDQKPLPKSLATMKAGAAALLPIYPESFNDVVRLARMAIFAGMIKPLETGWGDNKTTEPREATEARATMIIMQGMEVGLPPMQAVQLIAMINGRMCIHSEGVPSLLLSKGFKIKQEFTGTPYEDDFAAVCTLTRPDGEVNVSRFSVADAKEAGLWQEKAVIRRKSKKGEWYEVENDSPWFKYKKRMLWARALGFNNKDFASDATRGLMVREEMEDMIRSREAIDITPETSRTLSIPDIPEIPEDDDAPDIIDSIPDYDERIAPDQEQLFLESLRESMAAASTPAEREEVAEANEDIINRLSADGQSLAEKILEGRA